MAALNVKFGPPDPDSWSCAGFNEGDALAVHRVVGRHTGLERAGPWCVISRVGLNQLPALSRTSLTGTRPVASTLRRCALQSQAAGSPLARRIPLLGSCLAHGTRHSGSRDADSRVDRHVPRASRACIDAVRFAKETKP